MIVFGDPFQGSPIKGYNGPIETFCNEGDSVCTGNFELRPAHMSYPLNDSIKNAKAKLKSWAGAT